MIITNKFLDKFDTCDESKQAFDQAFPSGKMKVTAANLRKWGNAEVDDMWNTWSLEDITSWFQGTIDNLREEYKVKWAKPENPEVKKALALLASPKSKALFKKASDLRYKIAVLDLKNNTCDEYFTDELDEVGEELNVVEDQICALTEPSFSREDETEEEVLVHIVSFAKAFDKKRGKEVTI